MSTHDRLSKDHTGALKDSPQQEPILDNNSALDDFSTVQHTLRKPDNNILTSQAILQLQHTVGNRATIDLINTQLDRINRQAIQRDSYDYWFNDPRKQSKQPAKAQATKTIKFGAQNTNKAASKIQTNVREQVFVDPKLMTIPVAKGNRFVTKPFKVRFAYPKVDVGKKKIQNAMTKIGNALSQIVADLESIPGGTRKQQAKISKQNALFAEVFRQLVASPLNIFIASYDSPKEARTSKYAAETGRVYIDLNDVGNPKKLKAAIRMPLTIIAGGVGQTGKKISGASENELKRTLFHEALHSLLIKRNVDANAIWHAKKSQLKVTGDAKAKKLFIAVVRKYLIAQEEIFAYEREGQLYPPVDVKKKNWYDIAVKTVERLLKNKGLQSSSIKKNIPVNKNVRRKAGNWSITYKAPLGSIKVDKTDIKLFQMMMQSLP